MAHSLALRLVEAAAQRVGDQGTEAVHQRADGLGAPGAADAQLEPAACSRLGAAVEAQHAQAAAAAWQVAPSAAGIREGRAGRHAWAAAGAESALNHREEAEAVPHRTAGAVRREALRVARAAEVEAEEGFRVLAAGEPYQVRRQVRAVGREGRQPKSAVGPEEARADRAVEAEAQPAVPGVLPDRAPVGRRNDLGTACEIRSYAAARTASSPH